MNAPPPKPTVKSEHEWTLLSPAERAAALQAWQEFWLVRSTPAVASPSRTPIVIPPVENPETRAWRPSPEELDGFYNDDWKKS